MESKEGLQGSSMEGVEFYVRLTEVKVSEESPSDVVDLTREPEEEATERLIPLCEFISDQYRMLLKVETTEEALEDLEDAITTMGRSGMLVVQNLPVGEQYISMESTS